MGTLHVDDTRAWELRRECALTVFSCGDFRHDETFRRLIEEHYGAGTRFDTLTVPGGAFGIVNENRGEAEDDLLVSYLGTYIDLHQLERVAVILHTDCGRYRQHARFASAADERATLCRDLRLAHERVKREFPNAQVDTFIAHIHGKWLERLERVGFEITHAGHEQAAQSAAD